MTVPEEVYDDNDLTLGNWIDTCTPQKMKRWTEEKIFFCQVMDGGGRYTKMAESELSRRRNNEVKNHIQALKEATEGVHQEVAYLLSSSKNLEALTNTLKKLTWALIALTIVGFIIGIGVPIGIESWHVNHVPEVKVIELPPPPPKP